MDNTLVSARVSRAKKERAAGVLAEIGATTTELINSAFDFLLSEKRLPGTDEVGQKAQGREEDFAGFVENTTVDVQWPDDFDGDYKALMARLRWDEYETLA